MWDWLTFWSLENFKNNCRNLKYHPKHTHLTDQCKKKKEATQHFFLLSRNYGWLKEKRRKRKTWQVLSFLKFVTWPSSLSQLWAAVGTAVPELKHTLQSHSALQIILHLHCSASFETDECFVKAGLLRTKYRLTVVSLTEGTAMWFKKRQGGVCQGCSLISR